MISPLRTRILVLGAVTAVGLAATAARGVAQTGGIPSELGVGEAVARESFLRALWGGSVLLPGGQKAFLAAPADAQAALVRALGAFVKAYCQSEAFKRQYAQLWDANKPTPPETPKTMSEQIAAQRQAIEASMAQAQEAMKSLPPEMQGEMQKQMAETIAEMKAQQAELEKNTAIQAEMDAALKQGHEADLRQHEERLRTYAAEHPKDPNLLIARRLKAFVELSASVDFNARLVKQGNLMKFADPALEAKPSEWKLCFRAGKAATDAARAFATEWLRELEGR